MNFNLMINLSNLFTVLFSWLGICWAIYKIFEIASDIIIPEKQKVIANWLSGIDINTNIPDFLTQIFNSSFNYKFLSWSYFGSANLFVLLHALLLYFVFYINQNIFIVSFDLGFLIAISVLFGTVPTYLNLGIFQKFILVLSNNNTLKKRFKYFIYYSISTFIIFCFWFFLIAKIMLKDNFSISNIFDVLLNAKYKDKDIFPLYFLFLSYFLIIFYSLLFLISIYLSRFINSLLFFKNYLDIVNKPIKVIGFVFIFLLTIIYLSILILL